MTSTATHALRDKWFVSFLPLLTADTVTTEFKGDWKVAAQKKMQRLDWVTTVEEVWSTMNSLPKIQQLGVGTTFIFAREDKEPSFETFPNGSRLVVKLFKAPTTDKGLETIIAVVLGETITEEVTGSVPVCDVIRIAARPSREHADTVRVEVWLNDASYSSKVADYLRAAFRDRSMPSSQYHIEENPFEGGSPASPKPGKTPLSARSLLLNADNKPTRIDAPQGDDDDNNNKEEEEEEGMKESPAQIDSAAEGDRGHDDSSSHSASVNAGPSEGNPPSAAADKEDTTEKAEDNEASTEALA